MKLFPASIIAYTFDRESRSFSLSDTPPGWAIKSQNIRLTDFVEQLRPEAGADLEILLTNLEAGGTGSFLKFVDRYGTEWGITAYHIEGRSQIVGGLVSTAPYQEFQQLRAILDRLPALVWYKDNQNNILTANQAAAESVGLSVEEIEGRNTKDLFPEVAAQYLHDDLEVIRSGKPRLGYLEKLSPAGHAHKWIRTDKIPFRNPVTGTLGVIAASTDVTQLVDLEDANQALSRRFMAASEASGVGFWEHDIDEPEKVWWSPQLFKLLGLEPDEKGNPPLDRALSNIHPDDTGLLKAAIGGLKDPGDSMSKQIRVRTSSEEYIWCELDGRVEPATKTYPSRVMGSMRVIHARKLAEMDLKDYALRLETANEKLDSFAYIASHDLKAPLRGMANLVTWLEEDLDATSREKVAPTLELLHSRLARMETLLNDLRLYSNVGRQSEPGIEVKLNELIPSLAAFLDATRPVKFDVKTSLPTIQMAESAARHIFMNILSNSAKHAPGNSVQIILEAETVGDRVEVALEDDGAGIPEAYRERVFMPFKTLKPRDNTEGSGIGLAIVSRMMETLGGSARLDEPRYGEGARVVLSFPAKLVVSPGLTEKEVNA